MAARNPNCFKQGCLCSNCAYDCPRCEHRKELSIIGETTCVARECKYYRRVNYNTYMKYYESSVSRELYESVDS